MKIHPMWDAYPPLKAELTQTLALMEKTIQLNNTEVQTAIIDMIQAGGKLLRPAYQLLFSEFGPEREEQKAIAVAASIELLHTATLIHDDIVDTADVRRGLPSISHHFGNDVAVYAGDYLFICCFKLLTKYTGSLKSIELNSQSMEKILTGELGQMNYRYDYSGGTDAYINNISGKTAELFGLSCFIGAYESGASKTFANNARKIGMNIGIAFQIIDDILDYSQSSSAIGKPVLEDVRQGVYSLPLLLALETQSAQLVPLLDKKADLTEDEAREVYNIVQSGDSVTRAHALAEKYTQNALSAIKKLPKNPQNTREILLELTTKILNRKS